MHPTFFDIALPANLPRLTWMFGMAIALSVLGLAALIRAYRSLVLGLLASGCAIAMLFANRTVHPAPVHIVVSSFGMALAIGIALGMWVLSRAAARIGVSPSQSIRWLALGLLGGLLGSRVGYVLVNASGDLFWRRSLDFEGGGLFGYGAYIGGLLGATLASMDHRRQFRNWLDEATPTVLVCTALVRLGCYVQGCDFGRPLEPHAPAFLRVLGTFPRWGADPDGSFLGADAWRHHVTSYGLSADALVSLPTHPSQLYEAAFALFSALFTVRLGKSKRFAGSTFLAAVALFSAGRYSLELLRGDPDRGLMSLAYTNDARLLGSYTQLLALVSIVVAGLAWRKWHTGGIAENGLSTRS